MLPGMVVRPQAGRLLGRQRERAVLERLLDTARDGHGSVLVVHGAPGVGKTALLEYAVETGEDFRVVRAAGVEAEMELDYAALQQLCSPILEVSEHLSEPQRDAIGVAFGLSGGQPPSPFLVGLAVLGLLSEAAEQQPICAWSMTRSGSTAHRHERSRSWLAASWPRGSRSHSGRVTWDLDWPASRSSASIVGPSGCTGAVGVGPGSAPGRVRTRADHRRDRRESARASRAPARTDTAQLAGGFGLPAAVPLSTGIEHSVTRRLARLPRDARRLLLLAAAEPVGNPALLWHAARQLGIPETAAHALESKVC